MKRTIILLLSVLCTAATTFAYDFQSGDLYYNITSENTVAVTYQEYESETNYQGLTTAAIPETVTYNGTTYSVTSIGFYAFEGCSSLTSITIPNSVTSIGHVAFCNCFSLTSITIPNSVTSIGSFAFSNCSSLTSITIPNSVTSIEVYTFYRCSALTSITIPNSVTSIGNYAFFLVPNVVYNGTATGSPWGARSVNGYVDGYLVYADDTKTTLLACITSTIGEITIPNSVKSIGEYAFYGCTYLTSVTIPNSVTSIGGSAFEGCSSLTSITIPNSVTSIEYGTFYECSSLTSITIPNSVTSIGDEAFYGCSSFTSITLPNSLTSIAYRTFSGCTSLASVTIPSSVKMIEEYAFEECRKLRDIYCYAATPPTAQTNSFANYNVYVHVPCASLDAYDMDAVFGSFKYVECIGSEDADIKDKTVTIVPGNADATFTWPITDGAETYTLVITKDGVTFCTLVFNAQGQLVSIAFKPARQNAPATEGTTPANYAEQTANGFRFTVTNLSEGTAYAYTLTVRDAANSILETYTGEFTTQSDNPMGIQESAGDNTPAGQAEKLLRNGQVLILRNGVTYDMMGQTL